MKTAYELALERLEAENGPTRTLSDEEKAALAEIDKKYDAEAARIRLDYDSKVSTADSHDGVQTLKEEMAGELARIEERREREKDAIWGDG